MKSQLVPIEDRKDYSELQVLKSAAGYYIGSLYQDGSPGTRDSEYFPTEEAAHDALRSQSWVQRQQP